MIFIQKFAITCRVGLWNKQMPYFSSVSDEWSRDLKSVQVQKQLSCRARDLDESPDPSMSKIVLRNLIISSKYYKEEEAKSYWKLLQPKGDKVSNLLVNLGEEELKDYESLKQVVLKEYEPSPKICLENFRKAKRNSDETFSPVRDPFNIDVVILL
ncbi:hypothetical protein TNCV_4203721 [Trichonephila clavipes]|nr:hypothetical protein TNCV_4203721 [Trichonephila clavipes]